MGLRFRKSIKILPGLKLNISKSGLSTSIGGPGATINLSGKGQRHTVGIPGSGLSFSSYSSSNQPSDNVPRSNVGGLDAKGGCGYVIIGLLLLIVIGQCTGSTTKSDAPAPTGAALSFEPGETVEVVSTRLNTRSEPSTSGAVTGSIPAGSSVKVVGRSGDWLKIAQAGAFVWIAATHVKSQDRTQTAAVQRIPLVTQNQESRTTRRRPSSASTSHTFFGKVCKRGKPCGNACISINRVCRK